MKKKLHKTKTSLILTTLTLLSLGGITQSKYSKQAQVDFRVDRVAKVSSAGTYNYTIPTSGYYLVQLQGGDGGALQQDVWLRPEQGYAGCGGFLEAIYYLEKGKTVHVTVGTKGQIGTTRGTNFPDNTAYGGQGANGSQGYSASGGGMSEFYYDSRRLMVAGGGGGAPYINLVNSSASVSGGGGGGGSAYMGVSSLNGGSGVGKGNTGTYNGKSTGGGGGTQTAPGQPPSDIPENATIALCANGVHLINHIGNPGSGSNGGVGVAQTGAVYGSAGGGGGAGYYGGASGNTCTTDGSPNTTAFQTSIVRSAGSGGGGSSYLDTTCTEFATYNCDVQLRCMAELGGFDEPIRNRFGGFDNFGTFINPKNFFTDNPKDGQFNIYYIGKIYNTTEDDLTKGFEMPEFLK